MLEDLKQDLQKLRNPRQAEILQRFFKTGKGEYGEGRISLGIKIPVLRKVAKKYYHLNLNNLQELLDSNISDYKFTALVILIHKYNKVKNKKEIVDFYLKNTKNINNWDLVDLSAPKILGNYLLEKDKSILYKLAKSKNLWERRIAVLATFEFIKNNQFEDSLKIAESLIDDKHDLIHKAVGWMLREIGKRDQKLEEQFLKKHYKKMPRTMLRYAIERFPEEKRKFYMKK